MAKYDPLYRHLAAARVELSFADVERILGDELPASAWRHRAWWSGDGGSDDAHVQVRAWLDAGYAVVEVDQELGRVVFERRF